MNHTTMISLWWKFILLLFWIMIIVTTIFWTMVTMNNNNNNNNNKLIYNNNNEKAYYELNRHHHRILVKQKQQLNNQTTTTKRQSRTNIPKKTSNVSLDRNIKIQEIQVDGYNIGNVYLQNQMEQYYIKAFYVYATYQPTTSPTRYNDKIPSIPSTIIPSISYIPTIMISTIPSLVPTLKPSDIPSISPSGIPTTMPSDIPTNIPSIQPSLHPTVLPGYFNYDTSNSSLYGPGIMENQILNQSRGIMLNNNWGDIQLPVGNDNYWYEFTDNGYGTWEGVFEKYHPTTKSMCNDGNNQSPIDVRDNGGICEEFHQIRTRDGEFAISDNDNVYKHILSNKLQIEYTRRPCQNSTLCLDGSSPPSADFPHGWGGYCDVMHVDIKIPSEHYLNGIQYDGEMQIYHIHAGNKRFATQGVFIHVNGTSKLDDGSYNYYFQELIDQFQIIYENNMKSCQHILSSSTDVPTNPDTVYETTKDTSTSTTPLMNDTIGERSLQQSSLNTTKPVKHKVFKTGAVWDPHNWMLVPTYWFYRYDGSLTEPPCSEMVSWFIADTPMTISIEQYEQLKNILYTNVRPYPSCQLTSVHDVKNGNARPIRPVNDRPIWQCTPDDFPPDDF